MLAIVNFVFSILLEPVIVVGSLALYFTMQIYKGAVWLPISALFAWTTMDFLEAVTSAGRDAALHNFLVSLPEVVVYVAAVLVWYCAIDLAVQAWGKWLTPQ